MELKPLHSPTEPSVLRPIRIAPKTVTTCEYDMAVQLVARGSTPPGIFQWCSHDGNHRLVVDDHTAGT